MIDVGEKYVVPQTLSIIMFDTKYFTLRNEIYCDKFNKSIEKWEISFI